MNITPLKPENIAQASALFGENFHQLRRAVPALPGRMEDPAFTAEYLHHLLQSSAVIGAFDGNRLLGYLGWWLVDRFRDTDRKAAYCPVWAHAVVSEQQESVYRALYRAAATEWFSASCQAHAISILANDEPARQVWFWNGFGLAVVDAVRTLDPLGIPSPEGYLLRKAVQSDAEALASIDAEHWRHYAEPPTLMLAGSANTASEFIELLEIP
ncbi:MAG: hypothetical protein EHM21_13575, partial [Chloroflexi bacterium]